MEDQALTDVLIAANRDPRMYNRYLEYVAMLATNGVALFNNFTYTGLPSKYGSWGTLEYMDQPITEAPKYRALMTYFLSGGILWPRILPLVLESLSSRSIPRQAPSPST